MAHLSSAPLRCHVPSTPFATRSSARIAISVSLAILTLSYSPFVGAQTVPTRETTDAPKKKPAPNKGKVPQPSASAKLEVVGYEPVFLQKTTDAQAVRLVGTFPNDVKLDKVNDALAPQPNPTISDKEIFAWVTLAAESTGTVFLQVTSSEGGASVSFEIRDACASTGAAPAETVPTAVKGWENLCTIPTSPSSSGKTKSKRTNVAYGINALQHSSVTNPTQDFCKNSSAAISTVDLKDTYLEINDAARVVVCNQNPFRWTTTLSRDDTVIKNDDPSTFLGILDPMLGANNAAKAATDAANSSKTQSVQGSTSKSGRQVGGQPLSPPQTYTFGDPVQACVDGVAASIKLDDQKVTDFIAGYNSTKALIEDDSTECDDRRKAAVDLWSRAQELPIKDLNAVTSQINALKTEIAYRVNQLGADGNSLATRHVTALQAQDKALDQQLCVAGKLVTAATTNIPDSVVTPIQNILGTSGSFVYVSNSVGQYHDPTEVTWKLSSTLKNTSGAGLLAASSKLTVSPYLDCLSTTNNNSGATNPPGQNQKTQPNTTPPTKKEKTDNPSPSTTRSIGREDQGAYVRAASFVTSSDAAVPQNTPADPQQGGQKGGQKGAQNPDQANNPALGGDQQTSQPPTQSQKTGPTQEDGPQIDATFGGPEFVVSAGVAAVLLRNQQFQKVQANGQTSGTTIEYSTNSLVRMSPLIMAHARLYKYKRSDRAIWGTLGVTGTSNNNGVSAEYFVGASWSWLHNWMFLTPGLYVGQRQSLTGGYKVGQQLPSSFTGSLPVTQNYKPGFGLAISIRIPGTSTPKSKSTTSNSGKGTNTTTGKKTNSTN